MKKMPVWNTVPLADYEQHMQHESVGQAQLLNQLTAKYLRRYRPAHLLFLGVSGGNGLEHVEARRGQRVCGIDRNSAHLAETRKRFGATIKYLELITADISSAQKSFIKAAALTVEYVGIEPCFDFIERNTRDGAKMISTFQANNGGHRLAKQALHRSTPSPVFLPASARQA